MDIEEKLSYILQVLDRLDVTVRFESLGGEGGGLCAVKGARIVFVDVDADPRTRYSSILAAVAEVGDADQMYLLPEIRADMDDGRG